MPSSPKISKNENLANAILRSLRPKQWVKNFFVLAALVFSKHLFDVQFVLPTIAAFISFCALSGAVYTFNDLQDVENDRKHPLKRFRPIALGSLQEKHALWLSLGLATTSISCSALISPWLAIVAVAYLLNNLAYSLYLKRIAYLDVIMIAVGFLIRVIAGGFAIDVPVSGWLLACTGLLASFLGFGKRANELSEAIAHNRAPEDTRTALKGYNLTALRFTLMFLAIGTCAAYSLYTRDASTVISFNTDQLYWTIPFCFYGITRFLYITLWMQIDESPTEFILKDWPFLTNLSAWIISVVFIIYVL